jgi:hypothetical protein
MIEIIHMFNFYFSFICLSFALFYVMKEDINNAIFFVIFAIVNLLWSVIEIPHIW